MNLQMVLGLLARHVLTSVGLWLAGHGYLESSGVSGFVGAGMIVAGIVWSWWQKTGQAVVAMKLATLAKHVGKIPAPNAVNTSIDVSSAIKTAKAAAAASLLIAVALFFGVDGAQAQNRLQVTGNPIADTKANLGLSPGTGSVATTKATPDLITKIQQVAIADLRTASADAKATGDTVAAPCYDAWITLIEAQQSAQAAAPSDPSLPHVIATFQRDRDLVNALRPGSPMKVACAPLAEELKQDVLTLLSKIAGGVLTVPALLAPFGL